MSSTKALWGVYDHLLSARGQLLQEILSDSSGAAADQLNEIDLLIVLVREFHPEWTTEMIDWTPSCLGTGQHRTG